MEAMADTGNALHKAAWAQIFKKRRRSKNILKLLFPLIKNLPAF
jgi:hypothetical protein